ncbi:type I-E CRISPR-associated protein Cse2/CasB [Streptomyces sp. NPDC002012]|uniref:type I-E CRISPR-associated protein Cse2/CasB n=1 Tax=Streptomyces sp. NPDC002012 TaxID=3154532 RepID=UPI0033180EC2
MPTMAEHRTAYDGFVAHVHELCAEPGIRTRLSKGRGRPVEECAPMDRYLTRHTAGRTGRRAYYTTATLIALAGPQTHTPGVRPSRGDDSPLLVLDTADVTTALPAADPEPAPADEPDTASWFSRPNLGATFASAVHRAGHSEERTEEVLYVLTRLGDDQLHRRLPSHVARLLSDGLTPDWGVLLHDLIQRHYQQDTVGLRWRDAFYLALDTRQRA